jgi:hypothetical protein
MVDIDPQRMAVAVQHLAKASDEHVAAIAALAAILSEIPGIESVSGPKIAERAKAFVPAGVGSSAIQKKAVSVANQILRAAKATQPK